MAYLKSIFRQFASDQRGQSLIGYVLIVALMAAAIFMVMPAGAEKISGIFDRIFGAVVIGTPPTASIRIGGAFVSAAILFAFWLKKRSESEE